MIASKHYAALINKNYIQKYQQRNHASDLIIENPEPSNTKMHSTGYSLFLLAKNDRFVNRVLPPIINRNN